MAVMSLEPCEEFLQAKRDGFIAESISSSKVIIINRLLADRLNMKPVYAELQGGLTKPQWSRLLEITIDAALSHNPNASAEVRESVSKVKELNAEISSLADQLAIALRERRDICDRTAINGSDLYRLSQIINLAADANGHYRMFLKKPLQCLAAQYDGRYWPDVEDLLDIIAADANNTDVQLHDDAAREAINSPKRSKRDYLRGFFAELAREYADNIGILPSELGLTDATIAALLNTCCGDELFDAPSVKRARQQFRENLKGLS